MEMSHTTLLIVYAYKILFEIIELLLQRVIIFYMKQAQPLTSIMIIRKLYFWMLQHKI